MNFDFIWRISAIISMSIFTPIFIYRYLKEKKYEQRIKKNTNKNA